MKEAYIIGCYKLAVKAALKGPLSKGCVVDIIRFQVTGRSELNDWGKCLDIADELAKWN